MNRYLSLLLSVILIGSTAAFAADKKAPADKKSDKPGSSKKFIALYDTGTATKLEDSVASLFEDGQWQVVKKGETPATFKGDAVLANVAMAVVIKKDGSGIEIFAKGEGGWHRRTKLTPVAGKKAGVFSAAKAVANDRGAAAVEVTVEGGSIIFSVKVGVPILKSASKGKVEGLRIHAPARLGVLPDFFADDLLIDARRIVVPHTEIPSDNFFLHFTGNGEALVASIWNKNERDLEISLSGEGDQRMISSSDIFFGKEGTIWTAVLEQKGVWYAREFTRDEVIKGVLLKDWNVPFPAMWKGNFMREDKNSESMKFTNPKNKGRSIAKVSNSSRLSVQGADRSEKSANYVGISGVGVLYPINRTEKTPLDKYCLTDLMRESLGNGPCEYLLDSDSRTPSSKGIFTCSYGKMIPGICPVTLGREREAAERYKDERFFVKRVNKNMLTFVRNIQERTDTYIDFGVELMALIDEQEKKEDAPDLAEFFKRLRAEWAQPVAQYKRPTIWKNDVKVDNHKRAIKMVKPMYTALKVDSPAQLSKGYGSIRGIPGGIGDPGDRRLRNLRRKVMLIRSMATMEMAMNPKATKFSKEVRKRSEAVLRNPHSYEKVTQW